MLQDIWVAIGIIVGLIILIPLMIFFACFILVCMKEMVNVGMAAANAVIAWISEKIHKK